jgi:disabled family protein 2
MSASEAITPAATPTTPTTPGAPVSKVANDIQKFTKGFELNAKIIGVEDVKHDSGDEVCKTSMIKLKAVALSNRKINKTSKQKVVLKLTLEGIEIYDQLTHVSLYKHSVTRISYISRDPSDSRAIGYIYKNSANDFQFFALKTIHEAQELFIALKDLFEAVLETQKKSRAASIAAVTAVTTVTAAAPAAADAKPAETPDAQIIKEVIAESNQLISGLEDKIKQMNEQPNLLDVSTDR